MDEYGTIAGIRALVAARGMTLDHAPDEQIAGWIAEGEQMLAHGIAATHARATVAHRVEAFARPIPPPPPAPLPPPAPPPPPILAPVSDDVFHRLLHALKG